MRIKLAGVAAFALTLSACAQSPESIEPQYVSPAQYSSMDCQQVENELRRVNSRVSTLTGKQEDAQTRDAVATGVGLVLFWPALFMLAAGDSSDELARLKGEYDALQQAATQKNCGLQAKQTERSQEAAEAGSESDASGMTDG